MDIILLLSFIVMGMAHRYQLDNDHHSPYYMDFGRKATLCPQNKSCLDGTENFLCNTDGTVVSEKCKRFLPKYATRQSQVRMLSVHNGLRNKLAYERRLANMNLVYWNVHLEIMAEQYLMLCQPYRDTCRMLGYDAIEVGQNSLFVNRRHKLIEWEGRTVRHWHLEQGTKRATLEQIIDNEKQIGNFTQLMWPSLEFIGCRAAIMFNGFFIVCYYYPPVQGDYKEQITYLKSHETCVCPKNRLICSKVFTSLCGADVILYSGTREILQKISLYQIIVFIFIYFTY